MASFNSVSRRTAFSDEDILSNSSAPVNFHVVNESRARPTKDIEKPLERIELGLIETRELAQAPWDTDAHAVRFGVPARRHDGMMSWNTFKIVSGEWCVL